MKHEIAILTLFLNENTIRVLEALQWIYAKSSQLLMNLYDSAIFKIELPVMLGHLEHVALTVLMF